MIDKEKVKMNKMKKGMRVRYILGPITNMEGTIGAFDYNGIHVGVYFDHTPNDISWVKPDSITIISDTITEEKCANYPMPKRVIADIDAGVTVLLWDDGEKTIVRLEEGKTHDIYDAFCAAFCKRVYGTNSSLKRELDKILVLN